MHSTASWDLKNDHINGICIGFTAPWPLSALVLLLACEAATGESTPPAWRVRPRPSCQGAVAEPWLQLPFPHRAWGHTAGALTPRPWAKSSPFHHGILTCKMRTITEPAPERVIVSNGKEHVGFLEPCWHIVGARRTLAALTLIMTSVYVS